MELDQVRYFLALCKEKSFTRAARHCGISQPSLTNAIKRLEQKLGGELFCRSLTETTLSERGLAVRPHLEQLAQCADNARRAAASKKRLRNSDNYTQHATAPRGGNFISKSGGMERDPD
jgi:DNA-binding transcriptional LysR family regulator